MSEEELLKVFEYGAELWMILKKMHLTAFNRSQSLAPDKNEDTNFHLKDQFDNAHEFFINKIEDHSSHENSKSFEKILKILKADQNRNPNKSSVKPSTVDNQASLAAPFDGLSSQ